MAAHVFHWRHGWIPLDHTDAGGAQGVRSRRDVALAVRSMPRVPSADRLGPKHETITAAHQVGAAHLLPASWQGIAPGERHLEAADVEAFRGGSAERHLVTDAQGRTRFTAERQALHDRIIEGDARGARVAGPARVSPDGWGAGVGQVNDDGRGPGA